MIGEIHPRLMTLAQLDAAATTPTTLYAVPSRKFIEEPAIVVCNRNGTAQTFRVRLRLLGAVGNDKQYLYYDSAIAANTTFYVELATGLQGTDIVEVYASATGFSFTLFGIEDDA